MAPLCVCFRFAVGGGRFGEMQGTVQNGQIDRPGEFGLSMDGSAVVAFGRSGRCLGRLRPFRSRLPLASDDRAPTGTATARMPSLSPASPGEIGCLARVGAYGELSLGDRSQARRRRRSVRQETIKIFLYFGHSLPARRLDARPLRLPRQPAQSRTSRRPVSIDIDSWRLPGNCPPSSKGEI